MSLQNGVARFSVSVEPDLLLEFDGTVKALGYNRSSAIQIAMRDFMTERIWDGEGGEVVGAITILYDHHTRDLGNSLTDIQHDYHDIVTSTTHVHLDHDNCLEILAVKGSASKVKQLTEKLAVVRGLKQIKRAILKS